MYYQIQGVHFGTINRPKRLKLGHQTTTEAKSRYMGIDEFLECLNKEEATHVGAMPKVLRTFFGPRVRTESIISALDILANQITGKLTNTIKPIGADKFLRVDKGPTGTLAKTIILKGETASGRTFAYILKRMPRIEGQTLSLMKESGENWFNRDFKVNCYLNRGKKSVTVEKRGILTSIRSGLWLRGEGYNVTPLVLAKPPDLETGLSWYMSVYIHPSMRLSPDRFHRTTHSNLPESEIYSPIHEINSNALAQKVGGRTLFLVHDYEYLDKKTAAELTENNK